jgi:hypothetical protein
MLCFGAKNVGGINPTSGVIVLNILSPLTQRKNKLERLFVLENNF